MYPACALCMPMFVITVYTILHKKICNIMHTLIYNFKKTI